MRGSLGAHDRASLLQDGLRLYYLPDGPALALTAANGPGPALVRGQTARPGVEPWKLTEVSHVGRGEPALPIPHPAHGALTPNSRRGRALPVSARPDDDGPEGAPGLLAYFYASSSPALIAEAIATDAARALTQAARRPVAVVPVTGDPTRFAVAFPQASPADTPRRRARPQDVWI